jgi:hypothetical protein
MTTRFTLCGKEIRVKGRLLRIGQLEGDKYEFLDDPAPMLSALPNSGKKVDLFTFLQRLPDSSPKFNYPMVMDNLAAIPVSTFDNWWTKQISSEARNSARQAVKKGVEIREVFFGDDLVKGISEIYNETPVRQGRRFPHYGQSLESVHRAEATFLDSSFFIGAYLNEKLIGFVKVTADETRTQANLMNILSLIEHRDKAPTNALIAHAVKICAERGISYLVYQSFTYGNKQQDGIMKFKQVNGFQKMDIPRYYVPLTAFGRVAYKLGLHRRMIDRLPESLVGRVRKLRDAWYNRKTQLKSQPA